MEVSKTGQVTVYAIDTIVARKEKIEQMKENFDLAKKLIRDDEKCRGCRVCGVGAKGEVMLYCCNRDDCPSRITC